MKRLQNKAEKALAALYDIKEGSSKEFFNELQEVDKRELYKAIDALKVFLDNIPYS